MPPTNDESDTEGKIHEYTTQEIGEMLSDMHKRQAKYEKTMMNHRYDQENFEHKQAVINSSIDETLAKLTDAINRNLNRTADTAAATPATRGWTLPPSITTKPINFDANSQPKLSTGAPRFNGENVVKWISRIQKYYNHDFTPLRDRLYLTSFLLDDAAEEWFAYWEDNTESKTWDTFLLAVKKRFDPQRAVLTQASCSIPPSRLQRRSDALRPGGTALLDASRGRMFYLHFPFFHFTHASTLPLILLHSKSQHSIDRFFLRLHPIHRINVRHNLHLFCKVK